MSKHDTPEVCPRCGIVLPEKKINLCGEITGVIRRRPDLSYEAIACLYKVSKRTIVRYAKRAGIKRKTVLAPR